MADERTPPEGYDETLAVVKALRTFADEAKRRRPRDAERIDDDVRAAQRAAWRVYELGDER